MNGLSRYTLDWAHDEAKVEDMQRTRARKVERTWRGEITRDRIERDHALALRMNATALQAAAEATYRDNFVAATALDILAA